MMSYFNETPPEEWDLEKAVLAKIKGSRQSFSEIRQVFDSIRSDLAKVDNEVANEWKRNWNDMTWSHLTDIFKHPIASTSTSTHEVHTTERSNIDDSTIDTQSKKRKSEETSKISSQESEDSELSLYSNITENSEIDFGRMAPYCVIGESNISRLCLVYRNECIQDYVDSGNLTAIKSMAVNHVYLVDEDPEISSIPVRNDFFLRFERNNFYEFLPEVDTALVANINFILNTYNKENALDILFEYLGRDHTSLVARITHNLIDNYENAENNEPLFIRRLLDIFLDTLFPQGGLLVRDDNPAYLITEKEKLLKPDINFSVKVNSTLMFNYLIFEIRSSNSTSKNELLKLSLNLQYMINHMMEKNVENPVVYGVIGKGFGFDVYRMELVAPFVYLMVKIRSFYLPRDTCDFAVVLTTIPALLQVQQLIINQARSINNIDMTVVNRHYHWKKTPSIVEINI